MRKATCGKCGAVYKIPDSVTAKRVRCKKCSGVVSVPALELAEAVLEEIEDTPAPSDTSPSPPQSPRPVPENQETISTGLIDCPYCSEEIKSTAIKCKHCGSDLESAGQAQEAVADGPGKVYRFENTSIQLAASEKILVEVDGGPRALGPSLLVSLFGYYVLRHKSKLLITTKRVVILKKKTRDVDTTTLPMSAISSISVTSNIGALATIGAILGMLWGSGAILGGMQSQTGGGKMLGIIMGIGILLSSIAVFVQRVSTLIQIESTGGSKTPYCVSGSNQKNKITKAVDTLNALRMNA